MQNDSPNELKLDGFPHEDVESELLDLLHSFIQDGYHHGGHLGIIQAASPEPQVRSRGHEFDPGPVPYFRGD